MVLVNLNQENKPIEAIRYVNKLFLMHQFESGAYTYWIFGAHILYQKQDLPSYLTLNFK